MKAMNRYHEFTHFVPIYMSYFGYLHFDRMPTFCLLLQGPRPSAMCSLGPGFSAVLKPSALERWALKPWTPSGPDALRLLT